MVPGVHGRGDAWSGGGGWGMLVDRVHGPGGWGVGGAWSGGCMVPGGMVPGGYVHGPRGVHGPGGAWWSHPTVTAVGSTHPTGMHSCYVVNSTIIFTICKKISR